MGKSCPNRNVVQYYCDECEKEEKLYYFDNGEFCRKCIFDMILDVLDVVNGTK